MKALSSRLILGIILTVVIILALAFLISFLSVSFMRAANLKFFTDFTAAMQKAASKHEVSAAGLEFQGDSTHQYHVLFIDETTANAIATETECVSRASKFVVAKCMKTKCVCLIEEVPPPQAASKEPSWGDLFYEGVSVSKIPYLVLHIMVNSILRAPAIYVSDTQQGVFESSYNLLKKSCDSGGKLNVLDCKTLVELGFLDENGEMIPIKINVDGTDKYFAGFGAMNRKIVFKYFEIKQTYDENQNAYLKEFYISNVTLG